MKLEIVTGSGRGIGASTTLECAPRGMGVDVTYNGNPEKAENVVNAIAGMGGRAVALKLNIGSSRSFPEFRKAVSAQLNGIWDRKTLDFLVNNAGNGLYAPIHDVTEEQFDSLLQVHLKGPLFLTQTPLPLIEDGVATSSMSPAQPAASPPPASRLKPASRVACRF